MANISGIHDPTNGETQKEFKPGEYTLTLVKSDMLESKKNSNNAYLACEFEIDGEPRRVWVNYNLVNENQTATEIAWRDWNSICHACGKLGVQDSSEVHGIPFKARVGFDKGDPDRLKFSNPKPMNSTSAAGSASGAAQSSAKAKPWGSAA